MRQPTVLDTPCVEWQGAKTLDGYGSLKRDGCRWRAHRLAWTQAHGAIPPGVFVCHRCDNPSCINVAHLFLGTPADNSSDMVSKGRSTRQGVAQMGEANRNAKLTPDLVRFIRDRLSRGATTAAIARSLGVSRQTVMKVTAGRTWRQVV